MDTLSLLMQLLKLIVGGAKILAVAVAVMSGLAFIKYLSLKGRGLLPSVVATAFVISIVSANLADTFGIFSIFLSRLSLLISSFSGGVTHFLCLFAVLLCVAIAMRLDISKHSSAGLLAVGGDADKFGTVACELSNSYLAITPVLLS